MEAVVAVGRGISLAFEKEREDIETPECLEDYVSSKLRREEKDSSYYDFVRVGIGRW